MNPYSKLTEELIERDIKPSLQRILILDHLRTKKNHPTADQIYQELTDSVQSISKATVYNTLALFVEKGLVQMLSFLENEHHYDATAAPHGHFICERCGAIYDFSIDLDELKTDLPPEFTIRRRGVYYSGLCDNCTT